ncbi:MAG TPA: adenylate/guanylate cyclase domain-containing protein [Tepidisphaeraceae bacterium]|jgi:class 3 adenylate cyclase
MHFGRKTKILRALLPGLAITALVIFCDYVGLLHRFEDTLYDARLQFCQQFVPAPTKQLYHVDIDDAALESIGRWPWPRATLAEILDELNRAGAKVVALDITTPEPQPPTYLANGQKIDNDAILAQSIRQFGRVLVPVSFQFERVKSQTQEQKDISEALIKDPAISFDELRIKLQGKYPNLSTEDYLPVLREVLADRVETEISAHPGTLEDVQQRIIQNPADVDPMVREIIGVEYRIHESREAIKPLGKTSNRLMPDVLTPQSTLLMIPLLARAAAYTAFVDHLPHDDGVERSVPLWVLYNGKLYPQMGLALACATLGVPLDRLVINDTSLTIPLADGRRIVIPTHNFYSARLQKEVGYIMDIPWFGTSEWKNMYDYPAHHYPAQHLPISKVWQLAEFRKDALQNNLIADTALHVLDYAMDLNYVKTFLKNPPDPSIIDSRIAVAQKALQEADSADGPLPTTRPTEVSELAAFNARQALARMVTENHRIAADATEMKQTLGGKSILIGSIATSAFDFTTTPLHAQCPGVIVHGAIFNAIMQNRFLRETPFMDTAIATAGVGVLATIAVTLFSPWAALLATLLVVGGYCTINGFFIFGYEGIVLGAAGPIVTGGVVWGWITLTNYIRERAERNRITRRFSSYADQKLVDYVLAHPEQDVFAGEERELTCVFTDMRGYTSLMERLGVGVVPALSEYMGRMAAIIREQGGLLNKFLGDGIMFFYGAPEQDAHHAQRAVRTVLEMQNNGVPGFNEWLKTQGIDLQVAVRAGVATGFMIVGDAGSKRRSDYTVLGDSVNLASRLESANKHVGTMTMITARTAELCGGEFLLRPVAKIQVVGKTEPVAVYEPLAYASQATDAQKRLAEVTREIYATFIAAEFSRCQQWIALAEKDFGSSKLFSIYTKNCEHYLITPPAGNFDGRIVLEEK